MLAPDDLQQRLQEWADSRFDNRTQAAVALAARVRVSHNSARGYIDYRLDRATYATVYDVWKYLKDQGVQGV